MLQSDSLILRKIYKMTCFSRGELNVYSLQSHVNHTSLSTAIGAENVLILVELAEKVLVCLNYLGQNSWSRLVRQIFNITFAMYY